MTHRFAIWQKSAAAFRRWRHDRRTLHDLERLDDRSRRELALLVEFARNRADQDPIRSNRATSSRCGDQMKLSIGCTEARR
jgi:hypothetical protein